MTASENRGLPRLVRGAGDVKPDFDLLALLDPNGRIAIGDPAYVPAGIYGKQALTKLGLWGQVAQHLAPADNARNALAMVEHGDTPIGIVYRRDAGYLRRSPLLACSSPTATIQSDIRSAW